MVDTDRVTHIFQDPWALYTDAVEELERVRFRNAAEAWGATKRATDALILARMGEVPRTAGETDRELRRLGRQDQRVQQLVGPYFTRAASCMVVLLRRDV